MSDAIVGIIGALVGFLAAFFAEPVKMYFQNRASLESLRMALYKEMMANYRLLDIHYDNWPISKRASFLDYVKHISENELRTECYKHAISNRLEMYYQLREASDFNYLQTRLSDLTSSGPAHYAELVSKGKTKEADVRLGALVASGERYVSFVDRKFYEGGFDKAILERIVERKRYEKVLQRGKRASEELHALLADEQEKQ